MDYISLHQDWRYFNRLGASPKAKGGGASYRGSHALRSPKECPQAFVYAKIEHLVPLEKPNPWRQRAMDMGTLIHCALSYYYAEKMDRKPQWFLDMPDMKRRMDEVVAELKLKATDAQNVLQLLESYKRHESPRKWVPIFNEEEFGTTVGALDPTGEDEPEETLWLPNLDAAEEGEDPFKDPIEYKLPTLNNEVATCRPDLLFCGWGIDGQYDEEARMEDSDHGPEYIGDHKGASAGKDDKEKRLAPINYEEPDRWYEWQAMYNLHVVRQSRPWVKGFVFNRVKREIPFDFDYHMHPIAEDAYRAVPRQVRECVKKERQIFRDYANQKRQEQFFWACNGCAYDKLCYAASKDDREMLLTYSYKRK